MASQVPARSPSSRPQISSDARPHRAMSSPSIAAFRKQQKPRTTSGYINESIIHHATATHVVEPQCPKPPCTTSEYDIDGSLTDEKLIVSKARKNWMKMDTQVSEGHQQNKNQGPLPHTQHDPGTPKSDRKIGSYVDASGQRTNHGYVGSPSHRSPGAVISRWNTNNEKLIAPRSCHSGKAKLSTSFQTTDGSLRSPQRSSLVSVQSQAMGGTEVMKKRSLFEDDKSVGSIHRNRWKNCMGTPTRSKSPLPGRLKFLPQPIPDLNASQSSLAPQLSQRYRDPKEGMPNRRRTSGLRAARSKRSQKDNTATTIVRGSKVYKLETISKDNFISSSSRAIDDSRSWIRPQNNETMEDVNEDQYQDSCPSHHHSIIPEGDADSFVDVLNDGSEETSSTNSGSCYRLEISKCVSGAVADDLQHDEKTCDPADSDNSELRVWTSQIATSYQYSGEFEHKIEGEDAANDESPTHLTPTLNPRGVSEWHESDCQDFRDEELHTVEKSAHHGTFVVDKVPRKRSSRNVHNLPLWPPVIRFRKFASGISVGTDFSDEDALTASEGDFDNSFGDDDLYSIEDLKWMPPEQCTSYRIRYDGPTNLENLRSIYGLSPVPSHDNRFEPNEKRPSDGMPNLPRRDYENDGVPCGRGRQRLSASNDDVSTDTDNVTSLKSRPDVWITALSGVEAENAIWKVKRVWAVEEEDMKEEEHSVHNTELFRKIKSLVGAPDTLTVHSAGAIESAANDHLPKIPDRSWHVQTLVERKGKLDDFQPEQDFATEELEQNITVMAEEAVKEIRINERAIEEAKKRIKMLKGGVMPNQRMPLRRSPKVLETQQHTKTEKASFAAAMVVATEGIPHDQLNGVVEGRSGNLHLEVATGETSFDEKETGDKGTSASNITQDHVENPPEIDIQVEPQGFSMATAEDETTANNGLLRAAENSFLQTPILRHQEIPQEGDFDHTATTPLPDAVVKKSGIPVHDESQLNTVSTPKIKSPKTKSNKKNEGRAASKSPGMTRSQRRLLSDDDSTKRQEVSKSLLSDDDMQKRGEALNSTSMSTRQGRVLSNDSTPKQRAVSKSPVRSRSRRKLLPDDDAPKRRAVSKSPARSASRRKLLSKDDASKSQEISKPLARPGSRRKLFSKDDAPKSQEVSKSLAKSGSQRKLFSKDDAPKSQEVSKSLAKSGSQRKLLSNDDAPKSQEVSKTLAKSGSQRRLLSKEDAPKSQEVPKSLAKSGSQRKLLSKEDAPKCQEVSKSLARSGSQRKLLSKNDAPKCQEVSKSLHRSGSRRKLLSKDDSANVRNRSSGNIEEIEDAPESPTSMLIDVVLLSPDSNHTSTKKKKKKSKDKENSSAEGERETRKTKREHPKAHDADGDTSYIGTHSSPCDSKGSAEKDPERFEDLTIPERLRIRAASMVHNSDSESEADDELLEEETARPSSKTTLTSTLLKDSAATPWWQKNGEESRAIPTYSSPGSLRVTRSMPRSRRGGRRQQDDESSLQSSH